MEKQKMSIKCYLGFVICVFLFGVLVFVTLIMPMGAEKLDSYFIPKQERVEEIVEKGSTKEDILKQEITEKRFIQEDYDSGIGVYHDNELNVTCYSTAMGLSCIPDAEIGRT